MTLQPDFTSALLDFGKAIRKQRTAWQWTLERTAHEVLGNQDRKSYVSAVERGKKKLSPLTIQKFATAFDIDDTLVDALMGGAPDQDEAPTKTEQDADKLSHETEALRQKLKLSEALAVALAYEFAEGNPTDIEGALRELRRAFEVAAEQRARNALPSNVDAAVDKVLAEVNALNDAGEVEEAGAALRRALADQAEEVARQEAAELRLIEAGLAQATLERDAEWAADLEVRRWRQERGRYDDLQNRFDIRMARGTNLILLHELEVALEISDELSRISKTSYEKLISQACKANVLLTLGERTPGTERLIESISLYRSVLEGFSIAPQIVNSFKAKNNLGVALAILGERLNEFASLSEAIRLHREVLAAISRRERPMDWAETQTNLGNALAALGEIFSSKICLEEAVIAFTATFDVFTRDQFPMAWAGSHNNIGNAQQTMGEWTSDVATLEKAAASFSMALSVYSELSSPMLWAMAQNNLGNSLTHLGICASDKSASLARLDEAVRAYREALTVRLRAELPLEWANSTENLGRAFEAKFLITGKTEFWRAAEKHLLLAREIWEDAKEAFYIEQSDAILARLRAKQPEF